MMPVRCCYCSRFHKAINSNRRCLDCEAEFKIVIEKVISKYAVALKGLTDR